MKIKKGQLLNCSVILTVVIVFLLTLIGNDNIKRNDMFVLATFALNGFLWTILVVKEICKRAFSFTFMHWFFFLMFFFFVPLVQYINNSFPWISYRSDSILIIANLLLTIWSIFVILGGQFRLNVSHRLCVVNEMNNRNVILYIFCLIIVLAVAIWRIYSIGFTNMLSRSTSELIVSTHSSVNLIILHSIEAIAYYAVIIGSFFIKNKRTYTLVLFLAMLVAYPPTGLSRYEAAAIYLGLMLSVSNFLRKDRRFVILFLLGFLIVLPFLNIFRNLSFENVDFVDTMFAVVSNLSTLWLAGDYDAYTMVTLTLDYIDKYGMAWGYQLLGVLLFWIPRFIWNDKPVGSGSEVAESFGWNFTNISCPLPAEALINFNYIGVCVFALIIGILIKAIDDTFWIAPFSHRMLDLLYPVSMVFFFFMCRGDLMSSFAYLSAFVGIGIMMFKLAIFINKIRL